MFGKYFKKNRKKGLKFENTYDLAPEIIGEVKSMIEIAFEYAGFNADEIENIYVLNSNEEGRYSSFFYRANGQFVERHKLNDVVKKKVNVSSDLQEQTLKICLDNLENINSYFKGNNKEIPLWQYCSFDVNNGKLTCEMDYDKKLLDLETTEHDIEDEWMEKLKHNNY